MNTSITMRLPTALAAATCLFLAGLPVISVAQEGVSYQRIARPQPPAAQDRIEVIEFFWYGCPHCYSFEESLNAWAAALPEDVHFRRVPAVLSKNWLAHARAYYVADELGILDEVHDELFDRIHRQGKPTNDQDSLREFFVANGADGDRFDELFESRVVQSKLKQMVLMARRFGISGVPNMVVQGKYLVTGRLAGSNDKMLQAVDELIEREREAAAVAAADAQATDTAMEQQADGGEE